MSDDSAGGIEVVRYAGSDPYELSLAVARALVNADGGASEWVVLASGESWADAVTAGPLAASLGASVVLVPPGSLQTAIARPDLVEFLRSTGVRRVVIVGSPEVLPNHEPSVLFGLGMLPRNIERVHGNDPIETSLAIAERLGVPAELGELGRTVIIASDESVADAVAVGPLAAAGPFPLLLTASDELNPRIATFITEQEVAHVVLVGGTAAIASEVQEAIEAAGPAVTRLAGRDRSGTARLAAELFEQHTADDPACTAGPIRIGLTPAQHPEQALSASPLLARNCTPLRYTGPLGLPPELHHELFLAQSRTGGARLHAFANASLLTDDVLDVTVPPVRIAAWRLVPGERPGESRAVLAVSNGRGQSRLYPQTAVNVPLQDGTLRLPRPGWGPHGRYLDYRDRATKSVVVLDTLSGELTHVGYSDQGHILLNGGGASWSPDGTRLIFHGTIDDESTLGDERVDSPQPELTAELFLYDIRSGETTRLTYNNRDDSLNSWSADGTKAIFSSTSGVWLHEARDGWSLSVVNVDTGEVKRLWLERYPIWGGPVRVHENGLILFTGIPSGGWAEYSSEIFVIDVEGENLRQLTPSNCEICFKSRYGHEVSRPHSAYDPLWSPDGDKVLYWVWVRTYEAEASLQIHEFASGKGRILLFFGDQHPLASGRIVGWSNNDELFFWTGRCDDLNDGSQRSGCVARFDVNTGSMQQEFELPPQSFAGALEHPISVSVSPDREHFAVRYANAGLHVYSLLSRRWSTAIDTWSTAGGSDQSVAGGCNVSWADIGFRGSCNEILDDGA